MAEKDFEFDTKEFHRALRLYEKQSSKDFVEVIHKVGIRACFLSVAKMPRMDLGNYDKYDPRKRNWLNKEGRLMYALSAKDGWIRKLKRGRKSNSSGKRGIGKEATRRYLSKRKAKGYLSMMLLQAAADLGAPVKKRMPSSRSQAARTRAERASAFKLYADITSGFMERGALGIVSNTYDKALTQAAREMREYAEEKMAPTAAKHSARR